MNQRAQGTIGSFVAVVMGSVSLVVLAVTLLYVMSISAPIFEAVSANGPNGTDGSVINLGGAFSVFGTIGMLSIPVAVLLHLLLGDRQQPQQPRRRQ